MKKRNKKYYSWKKAKFSAGVECFVEGRCNALMKYASLYGRRFQLLSQFNTVVVFLTNCVKYSLSQDSFFIQIFAWQESWIQHKVLQHPHFSTVLMNIKKTVFEKAEVSVLFYDL